MIKLGVRFYFIFYLRYLTCYEYKMRKWPKNRCVSDTIFVWVDMERCSCLTIAFEWSNWLVQSKMWKQIAISQTIVFFVNFLKSTTERNPLMMLQCAPTFLPFRIISMLLFHRVYISFSMRLEAWELSARYWCEHKFIIFAIKMFASYLAWKDHLCVKIINFSCY